MAAVIVGLALAQFLPSPEVTLVMLGLTVIALLVASKFWLNRDGVSWASARFADMLPFLLGVFGTFALSALISETTGAWWIWILGAAIMAGIVLRTGQNYRREYGE